MIEGNTSYITLKNLAKAEGGSVRDMLVLAPQNDPFYCGQPAQIAAAEWFAEYYRALDFSRGVHLRRIHYAIVSMDPPPGMPNGKPYENTTNCWSFLGGASKSARYLGLVDIDDFDDRRNPDPVEYVVTPSGSAQTIVQAGDHPEVAQYPSIRATSLTAQQPYHVEVWVEKSTMNDVLLPLCRQHNVNLQTGVGEMSITCVKRFIDRVRDSGKPARILYISDFDPAGQSMPVAVARKIEFFCRDGDCENECELDIRLDPLVLTAEQVARYKLPRTPIKASERRRDSFEATHGHGAVELDALEALHSGELRKIVENAIGWFMDDSLAGRADDAQAGWLEAVEDAEAEALAAHDELVAAADVAYAAWIGAHRRACLAIEPDLRDAAFTIGNPERPEPYPVADFDNPLFDSGRDYQAQVQRFADFKAGGAD